jgi:hypothetical protein
MALWILLVALIYVISWAWLFSRVGKHTPDVQPQQQTTAYEEVI